MTCTTEHLELTVVDGVRFHVARAGSGPSVVLLHGFTGSTETWTELQSALCDRYTTIAVDITGHGKSDAPADPLRYSLIRFADDLREILDSLAVPRAAILGYSMGGRAALRFALRHPDRVSGLILESTSPGTADPHERDHRIASDMELADSIEREGVPAFVDRWERLPLWSSLAGSDKSVLDRLRAQRLANSPLGLANSLRGAGSAADPAVVGDLATIRTPVRILAGELDSKYVELGAAMKASIPRAEFDIVQGAGHMTHLEQPKRFGALVDSALDRLDREGAGWA
ncbi:MAG: 2-succinyl-6-hydroxy-2,4-cyclohexadiene-1-carboxylate synthase [Gemmatimonadaceae bacterium]